MGQTINDTAKNSRSSDVMECIKSLRQYKANLSSSSADFVKHPKGHKYEGQSVDIKHQCFQSCNLLTRSDQDKHRHSWNIASASEEVYQACMKIYANERLKKVKADPPQPKNKPRCTTGGVRASVCQSSTIADFSSKNLKALFAFETQGERQQEICLELLHEVSYSLHDSCKTS
jgi:hypothetical protein